MMSLFRRFALIAICVAPLHAQMSTIGSLRGRVVDPTGLAVTEAKVGLVSTMTGGEWATATDSEGSYQFPRVAPGRYRVTAEKPGFRKTVREAVEVAVSETAVVNLPLALGESAEFVTVEGDADIVQSQRVEIAGRVDERRVRELPLNGKNFAKLVQLAPGVASGSPNNPAISGARPVANSFTVDGVSANDERGSSGLSLGGGGAAEFSGASPNLISTEAVQEFGIVTSNADASFGRGSGGQVNIITKSGGNSFHGSLYEYVRNNKLDARDFFNYGPFFAKDGSRRSVAPPFKQNLFGGTIGGPIVRNRHFFFGNYEGFRQKLEQTAAATVPNAALIGLIPGEMGRLYRLFYVDRGIVPSTGNPAGSFSALPAADRAAAITGGFPSALFNGSVADEEAGTVLLSTTNTRDVTQNSLLIRSDHQFTNRLNLSARYAFSQPSATVNNRAVAGVVQENRRRWQSGMAQLVYTIAPTQILEVRGGLLRSRLRDAPRDPVEKTLADFGVDSELGLTIRANGTTLSPLVVPGATGFLDNQTVPQGALIHTWTKGGLTLRSGMDIRRIMMNVLLISNASTFQFNGIVGPSGILGPRADQAEAVSAELNTTLYGVNGGPTTPLRGWRSTEQEYFAQADYRWRRNVTFNFGVRYSLFGAYSPVGNFMGNLYAVDGSGQIVPDVDPFVFGRTSNVAAPVTADRPFHQPDRNNFQPRAGVAWSLGSSAATVVRIAWGMYTDRFFQRLFDFGVLNPPYAHSNIFTFLPFPKGARIPLDTSIPPQGRFIDPTLRNPNTQRFNAAVERRLASSTSVTVAYVGLRSSGLYRWAEPNGLGGVPQTARLDKRFARYRYTDNAADALYDSLQTYARHRFARGVDFTVSYTYSRNIDTYSQDVGDNSVRNPAPGLAQFPTLINLDGSPAAGFQGGSRWVDRPILAERGNSDFDVRHSLALSHVIEIPVGRGRRFGANLNRALDTVVGGISIAGVALMRSALPVYLSAGVDYADVGITTSPRPALKQGSLSDLYTAGRLDKTQHFLPKADADQRLGIPANVLDPYAVTRRNELRGPFVQSYDVSLIKKFALGENRQLGFEANFFNVFNQAILGPPVAVLSDARFGRVTGTLGGSNPRQIQLGLKFAF
jgi:hypothetical protein